jgi:methyl-accepting chemotaxis protein
MSFKNKIALVVSIIVFLGLAVFGLFSYYHTKDSSVHQVESSIKSKALALRDYIDLWVKSKKDIVDKTAKSLWSIEYAYEGELIPKLKKFSKDIGAMDAYIGFEDGRMILGSNTKMPDGYDPRVRPWYKKAKKIGKVGVTDAYQDASTKKFIVTIMAPIYDKERKFLGVYGIDLALDDLVRAIENAKFEGGYGTLQDSKGIIIAHPMKTVLGKDIKKIVPNVAKEMYSKDNGILEYTFKGKDKLLAFYTSKETGWKPSITFDKKAAYAFLNEQAVGLLILGLIILGITLVVIIAGTRILMKPLDNLNELVKEMASSEGDLRQRLEVKSNDEFGEVSSNINKFIEKLHEIVKTSKQISIENSAISEELSQTAHEVGKNVEDESKVVFATREKGLELSSYLDEAVDKAKVSQSELEKTYDSVNGVKNKVEELESTMQDTSVKEQNLAEKLNTVSQNATEVQELANVSEELQKQMSEISEVINKTIKDASKTVDDFSDTSNKVKSIVKDVDEINSISQSNVNSIENVSQASEHLHSMTEKLNNELNKFKS